MKKLIGLIILLILIGCSENDPMYPTKAQFKSIKIEELKTHLTYLASDEMKGRDTGSDELKEAAKYIADHLKKSGYKAIDEGGDYLQQFTIYRNKFNFDSFSMNYKGNIKTKFGEDIILFSRSQSALDINATLAYVVNGISDDKMQQFDPASVKGKIAVTTAVTKELRDQGYSDRKIARNLTEEHGAIGVIVLMPNDKSTGAMLQRYTQFLSRGGMSIDPEKPGAFMVYMNDKLFKSMLKKDRNTRANMSKPFDMKYSINFKIDSESSEIKTQNVVGVLEGTDPELKNQYVGFSAHYDHVGVREGMEGDNIFNGADDNGSGTTTLIEVSQALAMKPAKRSIIFIWYTAEEKGLVGSNYFTSMNPLVPLDSMVALINIDMVGRSRAENDTIPKNKELTMTDEIYVIGADRISTQLHDVGENANKMLNQLTDRKDAMFNLNYKYNAPDDPNNFYGRSDHYNFAKHGVPITFYFNGVHEDYHQATDHVDKIDFTKMRDIGCLAMAQGYYIANMPERIKKDKLEMKKEEM